MGNQINHQEENASTVNLDESKSSNSDILFGDMSEENCVHELDKFYDETEMEWINTWMWKKPIPAPVEEEVKIQPTVQVLDNMDSGYKRIKIEPFQDPYARKRKTPKKKSKKLADLPKGINDFFTDEQDDLVKKYIEFKKDTGKKSTSTINNQSDKKKVKYNPMHDAFPIKIEYLEHYNRGMNGDESASLSQQDMEEAQPTTFFEDNYGETNTLMIIGKDGSMLKCCPDDQFKSLDYGYIHVGIIMCLAISPNKDIIFTGGNNGSLKCWSSDTELLIHDYSPAHKYWIRSMVFTPCGEFLFTGSEDFVLRKWDVREKVLYKEFYDFSKNSIDSMVITSNNEFLFAGTHNGYLKKLTLKAETMFDFGEKDSGRRSRAVHKAPIKNLVVTKENGYLLSSDKTGTIVQWDISTHTLIREFNKIFMNGIISMQISSDGNKVVVSLSNQSLKIFTVDDLLAYGDLDEVV